MSHFESLHPAIQHHIVNSLGWRELRPFQDEVIPAILAGHHMILVAPTAGGKTEAAVFPLLSRMLTEDWSGLSILYVCPLRALLNNIDFRLRRYCSLLGRRSDIWHGDVGTVDRRSILRDPPDCLLTTPESLEVMLISPHVDVRNLFCRLRAVVVDEIHAFAGDDRGWHLLSVLARVSRMADRELQRIGLSATVGNPESLIDWLAGACRGERKVFAPRMATSEAKIELDYVGTLENAAVVISRLHRSLKRLVFVDSRSRAETLAVELRRLGSTTYVTHSSLSREERQEAEEAFASGDDCVIVATSVLELGVDVGDLDHVIQIDSTSSVAGFLQRMGRTGRRPGSVRNCLFLATGDAALLQAAGVIDLWAEGYVDSIRPPAEPLHVLAQQLMALTLQEGGIGRHTWREWIHRVPAFAAVRPEVIETIVQWMLDQGILWEDQGILGMGTKGEESFGRRNFIDLLSVFLSPPLFTVLQGNREVGFIDELMFACPQREPRVLLLGGRPWLVTQVDWRRRVAYVEVSEERGLSRWQGSGRSLSYRLCQAMKAVLTGGGVRDCWSRRAREAVLRLRSEFWWVAPGETAVVRGAGGELRWWTFGGAATNAVLARGLATVDSAAISFDNLSMTLDSAASTNQLRSSIERIRDGEAGLLLPRIDRDALEGLKFSACLPEHMGISILQKRICSEASVEAVLREKVRFVSA